MAAAPDCGRLLAFAVQLADAAAAAIRPYWRQPIPIESKADSSPVTAADRAAEQAMRALIGEHRPDDGIYGEEFANHGLGNDYVWVLDPIDGTRSFITGVPLFTTLIALLYRGKPLIGIIDQPITGDRWCGIAGAQTRLNDRPIHTRPCASLEQATMFTYGIEAYEMADGAPLKHLAKRAGTRRFNADGYAYGLLAAGFADIVCENDLKPFDFLALVPVIEGAGGIISDWHGAPLGLESAGQVLACGDAALHNEALDVLKSSFRT